MPCYRMYSYLNHFMVILSFVYTVDCSL